MSLRPTGLQLRDNLENRQHEGKQMTVKMATSLTGAPSAYQPNWEAIDWQKAMAEVRRLQMRIAKAHREGRYGKVRALQWLLTHSFSAKTLAVRRVIQNRGAKTPGVDNIRWKTSAQRMQAVLTLNRRGYKTKPLKRIYIPKKQKGRYRPLSIPPMQCRAMQALHVLALDPIAENMADKNSYGFRPLRSTADAIEQCFKALSRRKSAQYILEGDIRACFDTISHQWLLENTPMDTEILRKWLQAGYIDKGKLYSTELGTPQGGLCSPTLLVVTMSGLENVIKASTSPKDKVNVCIYADDFIITGASHDILENKVKPMVETFLLERGLTLSQEKTKITHINEGFDFLGMNIRKYKNKLIIKPAKTRVRDFLDDIRETIKSNATAKTENLIRILNPKIRGWANYYAHVCSKKTFNKVDYLIFVALWRWAKRRHPNKSAKWIKAKYFREDTLRDWIFFAPSKNSEGVNTSLDLLKAGKVPIKRHIKIRAEVTPYDPKHHDYLSKRLSHKKPKWWVCCWDLAS
ncbi:group II intron reverse transcriptase/maturase [Legionella pneumophila]|uniref:group II intron reverse transcriptase/maturase n=1 Tax=Legionella pneumophila TaxID=446 RepID=UPI0022B54B05|nr:group II intron reverse transcriptase/maturase [Legionella pneumophila]MCZ4721562.1 group II intron reverse transcriptase/maturase [Legionella pneumophila]MCZ4729233.1 group II intron reverse transcriptase/maturase [Legionella pneumophila]WBA03205.1 reverse transcriptase [Legionella pneumophila]